MQILAQIGGVTSTDVPILTQTCVASTEVQILTQIGGITSTEVQILTQIGGVSAADRARTQALVRHGFRLPSAMDNRPLTADEFWRKVGRPVLVGAPDVC